jgi:hypothetical protein
VLSTSKPISLAQDLALKASEPLSVSVQAPAQAGAYTLQWDLVQEKRIFSKLGAQPKNDNVSVGSPVNSPINTPTPVSEPK